MTIGVDFPFVLAAAKEGDDRAIERLYRDLAPLVLGYLRSRRAPDPEDLTSEVFVSMMTSIDRFDGGEDRFRSWLLTIAHRRMLDGARRSGRRPEDPVPADELGGERSHRADPESATLARLEADGVLETIDALTPDQRDVLLLRTVADLSVRDIAEVVGKPETAVKALLRRAVAGIARRLDQEPAGTGGRRAES